MAQSFTNIPRKYRYMKWVGDEFMYISWSMPCQLLIDLFYCIYEYMFNHIPEIYLRQMAKDEQKLLNKESEALPQLKK